MINFNCCVSILHWIVRNVINTIHKFLVKVMAGNVFRLDKHWCWSIFSDLFFILMSASNFARLLISFCFVIWVSFICKKIYFMWIVWFLFLYKQKWFNRVSYQYTLLSSIFTDCLISVTSETSFWNGGSRQASFEGRWFLTKSRLSAT